MAEENLYREWLKRTKKKFPHHDRGERLERFAEIVKENPAFQAIYNDFDDVDGDAGQQFDDVDGGPLPRPSPHEMHLLFDAAREGCFVAFIEPLGRHVNYANTSGETALHVAVENGNYEDVREMLLNAGAEMRADNKGLTPLHVAAAATEPKPQIAKLLVERMTSAKTFTDWPAPAAGIHDTTKTTGNTALHLAADNEHASRKFIHALKDINPTLKNQGGETAFHVAAKAAKPDIIVAMLKVFSPANSGWKMKHIETESGPTLLEICAKSGNAEAVALLIKYGATISERVLFKLIDESVKHPTKTDKLIGVYRTIADNCVLSDWLSKAPAERQEGYPRLGTEPEKHREKQRELMLKLLTTRTETFTATEHAIVKGDKAFLYEIVNTPHVYRIPENNMTCDIKYDITDFIKPTPSVYRRHFVFICLSSVCRKISQITRPRIEPVDAEEQAEQVGPLPRPDNRNVTSYLDLLTQKKHEHLWKNTDVFQLEPFFAITRPICMFVQLFYFAMALIQLLQMIVFSVCYMPPYSSLSNRLNFKLTAKWNLSEIPADVSTVNVPLSYAMKNFLWLLWPTVIWLEAYSAGIHQTKWRQFWYECLTARLVFAPVLWTWYFLTFASHQFYLSFTSPVYLCGWLVTLSFFTATFENASIFSFLLKEIIVRDILLSFGIVFFFVLVGFSSTIHLLRVKALLGERDFFDTMYNVFASALTTGNFMDETSLESTDDKDRIHLLRATYAIYLCCATIILLNLLISMMNNRYEEARQKAKNFWTFRTVHLFARFGCSLQELLLVCRTYWSIVTHTYWKLIVDTRYDKVSIVEDGDRFMLRLKYRHTS